MQVRVVAVGKLKDRGLRRLVDDYAQRVSRYGKFEEVELRDSDVNALSHRLRKEFTPRTRTIALEVNGQRLTSPGLADVFRRCQNDAIQRTTFFIGGAYGLPPDVSRDCDLRISLSDMTLPHRLARLLLVEQVYRAFTIIRGEPYSHD